MLPYQRRCVRLPHLQGGDHRWRMRRIAESDRDIPQPAFMPNPADGAAFSAPQKLRLVPAKQIHQTRRIQPVPDPEIRFRRHLRKAIPRTNQLAIITTVNPVAQ